MKFVIQRVENASVEIDKKTISEIGNGFLVLIGITHNDTKETADYLINKLINLRVFEDENGKLNLSLNDIKGELLLVSQFTLYGDCSRGNRPSFTQAANPEYANELYEYIVNECKQKIQTVKSGVFGANMKINLINDGPVTIIMEK
ncbi:MAG: D-tyrosyl-tRNA(Tyr) deacylase [Clostridia bacterium]|nr:D-tyrosyl-tRNA(Tyr) deacylase [Clostridia bacterium]